MSKAVLTQNGRLGIDIGFFSTFTQLLSLMAKAAGYTQLGLPHLCLSGHVSRQAKREAWDQYVPMTRALTMMLLSHRTLGSHNSRDKSRQLSCTQTRSAAFGHDSFCPNQV